MSIQFIRLPTETGSGHLLRNMVLFGRLLRALGMKVTSTQILDLVDGLKHVDISSRQDFKNSARTLLVNHYDHLALFDRAFDLFWQARAEGALSHLYLRRAARELSKSEPETAEQTTEQEATLLNLDDSPPEPEQLEATADKALTYSDREVLRQKDFATLTPEELDKIKLLMRSLQWQLEQRRTRRKARAPRGAYLDMRRTLRQNLRYGGEPLQLTWRRPKLKRRPLVVICDISGSMERYSRILLEFIYVISNGLDKVEAFVFSTRLTRITRQIKQRNIDEALDQAMAAVHDWGGGTRIGESLKTFNFDWARRVLGQGAIVLMISDGWDRGDISLLDREIQRLQLSCQRLVWLNPLLGSKDYQPLVRGIQTVLPHIDDFLPVHNLTSLEQLGNLLQRLGEHKPLRRQQVTQAQVGN
jgi:uncharacterized protein with von Willebrand factor type A (vWA) domain